MTDVPATFRAYLVTRLEDRVTRGPVDFPRSDLPAGDVEIRVDWSSVNYKDGLAARFDGKVARISPLIPGIDLAGTVVASTDPAFQPGDAVLANGYELGVARHGGYAEYARLPADWVVPSPAGLTAREAMAIGTAGFTAAMGVVALETRGLAPRDGPVLVTGAAGGVGSLAIGILAARGYEVWAATGKADQHDRLARLGATGFLGRDEVTADGRPLETERWAGAIDAVGGPTLPYVLRTLRRGAAAAAVGNAGGASLTTTVFPFILRGNALLGMDSVAVPIGERRALWSRLAADLRPRNLDENLGDRFDEVTLDDLEAALDAVVAGTARGRWLVRIRA